MALTDRIIIDPKILTGKAVVRGTRISVELVVELLAAGCSHAQILASYPHLSEEDIRACLASQDGMTFVADENFPRPALRRGRFGTGEIAARPQRDSLRQHR